MQSSMISKIEKAKRYAEEKNRITFTGLRASFEGEHDTYELSYESGKWHCTCQFFDKWGVCSHCMALQRILAEMLPPEAVSEQIAE